MSFERVVNSLEELPAAAKDLLSKFSDHQVFAFYGEMGAGKTTFIKVLCDELGVQDVTSSPTFSIVNEYETATGELIYHFDFYRLEDPREALDIGWEDYLYSGARCFLEWPERIEKLLPDNFVSISISEDSETRTITAKPC